jgi:hypothetical protein
VCRLAPAIPGMRSQSSSRMLIAREALWRGFGFQRRPGRLELGLGRVEVLGRAHRKAAVQVNGDAPQPPGRHAFGGKADPTNTLPAIEHGVITEANCAELEHNFRCHTLMRQTADARIRSSAHAGRCRGAPVILRRPADRYGCSTLHQMQR